jgi:Lar family restriction alleviation protein
VFRVLANIVLGGVSLPSSAPFLWRLKFWQTATSATMYGVMCTQKRAVTTMAELKQCPFCGGGAAYLIQSNGASGNERGWLFGIVCKKCGVTSPKRNYVLKVSFCTDGQLHTIEDEREAAIEAWNRRVNDGR